MCCSTIVIHLTVMNVHTRTFTHSGISCIRKMAIADWFLIQILCYHFCKDIHQRWEPSKGRLITST